MLEGAIHQRLSSRYHQTQTIAPAQSPLFRPSLHTKHMHSKERILGKSRRKILNRSLSNRGFEHCKFLTGARLRCPGVACLRGVGVPLGTAEGYLCLILSQRSLSNMKTTSTTHVVARYIFHCVLTVRTSSPQAINLSIEGRRRRGRSLRPLPAGMVNSKRADSNRARGLVV